MGKRRKQNLVTDEQYAEIASYRRARAEGREPTASERAANSAYVRAWNKANPDRSKAIEKRAVANGKTIRAYARIKSNPIKWERLKEHSRKAHEKFWDKKQDQRLARQHGVTWQEIAAMRERPCGICGTFIPREKTRGINKCMVVDHCHTTGALRGTLCGHCNTAIGLFKDDIGLLRKAIEYLTNNTPP